MTLPLLPAINVADATSEPNVAQLTTQSIDGTGVFDVLMKTVKAHLIKEYDLGRISGAQYAEVYLGALQATLQQSITYLMNHKLGQKVEAEIGLTRQKTATELAQTDDDILVGLGYNGDSTVQGLVALQKAKVEKDGLLIDQQILESKASESLVSQRIITELSQTDDSFTQAQAAGYGYNSTNALQGVLKAALLRQEKENILIEQKTVTEVASTSDTKPASLGVMDTVTNIDGLVGVQKTKAAAEGELLGQKTATEFAQTGDTLPAGKNCWNTILSVSGSIGKQKDLFTAQTSGFARDAEQKLAKMMIEAWSVDRTIGTASANDDNQLHDASLGAVIEQAKTGIDVQANHPDPV